MYFLTLDIGTTAVKCCLFDTKLELFRKCSVEYTLNTGSYGYITLEPEVYWQSVLKAVHLNLKDISASEVLSIGVTTQGETLIPVDRDGNPLADAIVWLDARAGDEALFLRSHITDDEYYTHTGISAIDPANPVCKLLWYKNNMRQIYDDAYKFLLLEDYILFRLTGTFQTDDSIMSSTGYLDIMTGKLWDKIFDLTHMDSAKIPDITNPGAIVGKLTKSVADELGINDKIPVICGGMDQLCSAIGACNIKPGVITETTGTALAICATTESFDANKNSICRPSFSRHINGRYIIMPYNPSAGIILKWFKEQFMEANTDYSEVDSMAAQAEAGKNGIFAIPHFEGKLTPEYAGNMKGAFIGLTLNTKKSDLARAIMESIAFTLRENVEMLNAIGVDVKEIYSLGGGAKSWFWSQLKADICRIPIKSLVESESTSLGMAMQTAVALGYYKDMDELVSNLSMEYKEYKNSSSEEYDDVYRQYLKADKLMKEFYS